MAGVREHPLGLRLGLVGDDVEVPLLGGRSARYANFDFAASAPALVYVEEVVREFLPWYSSVHRGEGFKSQVSTAAYEVARDEVAAFVNARGSDVVVFTRNTTDSMNLLASALPDGTEVVVFESEHHANLLPWRRHAVHHVECPARPDDAALVLDQALKEVQADNVLVAVTAASNVTGEIWPVAELVQTAHRHGARVVVDAAQYAPHAPVDLTAWDADWVAFSGHKLYAPYGAGVLVGSSEWIGEGAPFLRGGGAVLFVTLDQVGWGAMPDRQEAGSPNVVGAVALGAACRALREAGMDRIAAADEALGEYMRRRMREVAGLTEYSLWGDGHPRIAVSTFNVPPLRHSLVAAALSAEYGVGVRHGCFCAHPLVLGMLGISEPERASVRRSLLAGDMGCAPGAVRASAGLSTTREDVDRLVESLSQLATAGPGWTYRPCAATGSYRPEPDDRLLPNVAALATGRVRH